MSEKKYPTRMHEVLGVEPEEKFVYSDYGDRKFWLSGSGLLYRVNDDGTSIPATQGTLVLFINNPERITRRPLQEDDDGKRGLYSKYKVTKADGTPLDGDCFVLRPDRDEAAISALEAYADATNNENLAADIREWLQTPRRPRLTEEQVKRLRALIALEAMYLAKNKDGSVGAFINKPAKNALYWNTNDSYVFYLSIVGTCLSDLVSWSDPEPLDIVQTLRDAGVEVEE